MKTSNKDFVYFKKCCQKWIKYFGLLDWEIYYEHENGNSNHFAWINYNVEARSATLTLNTEWPDAVSNKIINETAFHEVCHLLLGKLHTIAENRYFDESVLMSEEHGVIATLENVLLTH